MSGFQPINDRVDKARPDQFYKVIVQNVPNPMDSKLKGFLDAANAILATRFIRGR